MACMKRERRTSAGWKGEAQGVKMVVKGSKNSQGKKEVVLARMGIEGNGGEPWFLLELPGCYPQLPVHVLYSEGGIWD